MGDEMGTRSMNDDELDVEMLMYDLQRRIDATQLPGGRTVIKFLFRGAAKVRALVDRHPTRRDARIMRA